MTDCFCEPRIGERLGSLIQIEPLRLPEVVRHLKSVYSLMAY